MKTAGQVLWEIVNIRLSWESTPKSTKEYYDKWAKDFLKQYSTMSKVSNVDEQTDDSSGVPSQCSGVFVQTLENE